jgi:hypothetical protein
MHRSRASQPNHGVSDPAQPRGLPKRVTRRVAHAMVWALSVITIGDHGRHKAPPGSSSDSAYLLTRERVRRAAGNLSGRASRCARSWIRDHREGTTSFRRLSPSWSSAVVNQATPTREARWKYWCASRTNSTRPSWRVKASRSVWDWAAQGPCSPLAARTGTGRETAAHGTWKPLVGNGHRAAPVALADAVGARERKLAMPDEEQSKVHRHRARNQVEEHVLVPLVVDCVLA